ncbi:hypothetical protein C2G38_2185328 [Gigaspora rosea]|uniref:Uncharacterized protein n=1 Tax=Gigaspora rosea TaxID=44941 RepID=A0A397V6T2_9GLOM|nr:hypothetical protein C2G38_2185328 [Gigaspora rosea]
MTPFSKESSSLEFWSKASDPTADKKLLENLYNNNVIQLNKTSTTAQNLKQVQTSQDSTFWNSYRDTLTSNKRGSDGKILILSIIALNFTYNVLKNELGVENDTVNKARRHAQLYGPGAPPLEKPKRIVQRFSDDQNE